MRGVCTHTPILEKADSQAPDFWGWELGIPARILIWLWLMAVCWRHHLLTDSFGDRTRGWIGGITLSVLKRSWLTLTIMKWFYIASRQDVEWTQHKEMVAAWVEEASVMLIYCALWCGWKCYLCPENTHNHQVLIKSTYFKTSSCNLSNLGLDCWRRRIPSYRSSSLSSLTWQMAQCKWMLFNWKCKQTTKQKAPLLWKEKENRTSVHK